MHGRVLPTCLGMKIARPDLTVIGFSGDGDAYAEDIEHLSHAARYNADIKYFAGISGDNNPVHMSDEFAKESKFGGRIAHGLLSASFFSAIFGTKLPGTGCVYV